MGSAPFGMVDGCYTGGHERNRAQRPGTPARADRRAEGAKTGKVYLEA